MTIVILRQTFEASGRAPRTRYQKNQSSPRILWNANKQTKNKSQSASRRVFCAGPVSSAGPKMILDTKLPRVRQVKSSRWHMVHRNVLSTSRLSGRRRCGKRSVTCYHFFKHSRGFLWFMLCNWLLTANNAHSEAQLLINVQNQVRIALELPHFPCISICTLKCNVCECQNGLLSVANRARHSNIDFEFEIHRETVRERGRARVSICYCASAAMLICICCCSLVDSF